MVLLLFLFLQAMGRIMGIDYGIKRTGIAVTDETRSFAFALTTVPTARVEQFIEEYMTREVVVGFVVGDPRRMNNLPSEFSPHVEGFVKRLKKKFPDQQIYRIDERFTSSLAQHAIRESGIRKKERASRELVDQVSATIILQSWIERKNVSGRSE
jgi:putative holliday junction resolvase